MVTIEGCTSEVGHWQHYRLSALDEARQRDLSIALHFYDASNSICAKQKASLESVIKHKKFKPLAAYRVQMGSEPGLEKFLKVTQACTVVVFKGEREIARLSSETDKSRLGNLLTEALE